MHDVTVWNTFFVAFRSGLNCDDQNIYKLRSFLGRFRKLYVDQKTADSHLPTLPQIPSENYQIFLSKFKPAIRNHYAHGLGVNVWKVASVKYDEVRNSAILAWLLDSNGSHGQGNIFLEGLLSWLADNKSVSQQARENLPKPGCTEDVQYRIRPESLPLGEKESRVDIEISGPFVLIIEVKINATENGDQLRRYLDIARKKAGDKKWGVLFLTRYGTPPNDTTLHDSVCRISWKQMISIINDVTDKKVHQGSFIEHQIKQFCSHIKSL